MLSQKQGEFLTDIGRLLVWVAEEADFDCDEVYFTAGDFYATSGHMPGSLHGKRLAADLNLFVNRRYIRGEHRHWWPIGDKWKSLHPENRWGGDFTAKDFNHFSRYHNGVS